MKTDVKSWDEYKARHGQFRIVEVPGRHYLMIDGRGDPNTAPEYAQALEALYPVAYRLKFASKAAGADYTVPPLEALWWADDMATFTTARDKSQWSWTVMLLTPSSITAAMVERAVAEVELKSKPAALERIRWVGLDEGRCVQTLHIGPYDAEAEVLADMHERFIPEAGFRMSGRHHEIYLNDARRTNPAKLRTILRQPVVEP